MNTRKGPTIFTAESTAPKVLMIHGFKRSIDQLASWRDRIPDLGFLHLPGHGLAPALPEVSVRAWVEALQELLDTFPHPPLLIGESLGALVALALRSRAVIAVEPLLSTNQLWPLHRTIEAARSRGVTIAQQDVALFDEPFYWVLSRITAPTLILAGSTPLLPERPVYPEPSLLTDDDFAAYADHPLTEGAQRIQGGHTLLDHNPQGVMDAAMPFMLRHGYLPGGR